MKVLIILGSKSDIEVTKGCGELLDKFRIPYMREISSAHRQPQKTRKIIKKAEENGVEVIIAAAGMAAHLPGVVASMTTLPVIGIPLPGSALAGVDSLYSIVQMPAGIPVACMAIGSHGARNAAILAAEILALGDDSLKAKLKSYRDELAAQ
ncbi:MAG: 5-(carboxyamino)imidazole ribonucleotide mutase [Candidatus Zixiibacteriota bacterium]|nr:MAG: 5-(carboxyamino)imidazole ribonucleotide mutase [candidate division Zixibacteria bacterium]